MKQTALQEEMPTCLDSRGRRGLVRGGWRENKPHGGILMDVASGEIISRGLSMPHSPRWHDRRLWPLESGTGRLPLMD
jgi:uncharacterized protein (TIGR03032 family)